MPPSPWMRYRPEFKVPKQIVALVDSRILRDSTTEDSTPNFSTRFPDGSELVLWVDHPERDKRWFSERRYSLMLREPRDPQTTLLDTDDLHELMGALRQAFDAKGGPRPLSG